MRRARSSRSRASSGSWGHIGLKLYHCSGAAATVLCSASATRWVARWSVAGSDDGTSNGSWSSIRNRPCAVRRIASGAISAPVLAASVAGPAGSVVQWSNRRTGMPSGRYPQSISSARISFRRSTVNSSRRLRHGMTCTPHDSRCRRSSSNSSGNDESSATTLAG